MISVQKGVFKNVRVEDLLEELPLEQGTVRVFGKEHKTPRLMSWHGEGSYTFSGETHPARGWTPTLQTIRKQVELHLGRRFNSCLANYYRNGQDSVAWHSDDEHEMGDVIVSISLGGTRRFLTREKTTQSKETYTLEHGDMVVMSGDFQKTHEHCVPKTAKAVDPRLNLTFRVRLP